MTKATIEGKKTLLAKYQAYLERLMDSTAAREAVFEDFVIQAKRATRLVVGMRLSVSGTPSLPWLRLAPE